MTHSVTLLFLKRQKVYEIKLMYFCYTTLARMFHELLWRDHEDGRATGQPQGVGPEAYLDGASRGELVVSLSKEHPRTPGRTAISAVAASDSSKIRATLWLEFCGQKEGGHGQR